MKSLCQEKLNIKMLDYLGYLIKWMMMKCMIMDKKLDHLGYLMKWAYMMITDKKPVHLGYLMKWACMMITDKKPVHLGYLGYLGYLMKCAAILKWTITKRMMMHWSYPKEI